MSKKSDKILSTRRMAPAKSKTYGKGSNGKVAGKLTSQPSSHRKAAEPEVNLLAIRITAGVVAALCLAGGIAVAVLQKEGLGVNVIIEEVLLGLITALGVYIAIKPEMAAGWVAKLAK